MTRAPTRRIVTVSGVHGVGKSTLVSRLCRDLRIPPVMPRLDSVFRESVALSMFFYVLAFGQRELRLKKRVGSAIIDRDQLRDLLVDGWTLYSLGHLSANDLDLFVSMCRRVLLPSPRPLLQILLDDAPANVMARLRRRGEKSNRFLERDLEYVSATVLNYRREFESEAISVGRFNMHVASDSSVICVDGRPASTVARQALGLVRRALGGA